MYIFTQNVFIAFVFWNMHLLPGDHDWHMQDLGIGVEHGWLSWQGAAQEVYVNILGYFSATLLLSSMWLQKPVSLR